MTETDFLKKVRAEAEAEDRQRELFLKNDKVLKRLNWLAGGLSIGVIATGILGYHSLKNYFIDKRYQEVQSRIAADVAHGVDSDHFERIKNGFWSSQDVPYNGFGINSLETVTSLVDLTKQQGEVFVSNSYVARRGQGLKELAEIAAVEKFSPLTGEEFRKLYSFNESSFMQDNNLTNPDQIIAGREYVFNFEVPSELSYLTQEQKSTKREVVVRNGQTIEGIVKDFCFKDRIPHFSDSFREIRDSFCRINGVKNPNLIYEGQVLTWDPNNEDLLNAISYANGLENLLRFDRNINETLSMNGNYSNSLEEIYTRINSGEAVSKVTKDFTGELANNNFAYHVAREKALEKGEVLTGRFNSKYFAHLDLGNEFSTLKEQGYSVREIKDLFEKTQGQKISLTTIRKYMNDYC